MAVYILFSLLSILASIGAYLAGWGHRAKDEGVIWVGAILCIFLTFMSGAVITDYFNVETTGKHNTAVCTITCEKVDDTFYKTEDNRCLCETSWQKPLLPLE